MVFVGREIDLDAVATVRPEPAVLEAMEPWGSTAHAHPDSAHARGARARRAVEQARAEVAALVGVSAAEIVFTSGATESNRLAIETTVRAASGEAAPFVVAVGAHEPASLLHPCRALGRSGARVSLLPVSRDGVVDPGVVPHAPLSLLALTHAHPELGTVQSVPALTARARRAGARSLVEVSWSVGRIPADRATLGDPDLLSFSFHRLGGPMGVGALAVREGALPVERPGTPHLPGIVGAGAAARIAVLALGERGRRLARLGEALRRGVLALPGVRATGPDAGDRLPGHVSFLVEGIDGEALVTALDSRGVLASTGSACADRAGLPSASLLAAGFGREEARAAIVLCVPPAHGPDESEIEHAVAVLGEEVARLRHLGGCVAPSGG